MHESDPATPGPNHSNPGSVPPDPCPADPWASLAETLGVGPGSEAPQRPASPRPAASRPPQRRDPVQRPARPAPAAGDWDELASSLGIEAGRPAAAPPDRRVDRAEGRAGSERREPPPAVPPRAVSREADHDAGDRRAAFERDDRTGREERDVADREAGRDSAGRDSAGRDSADRDSRDGDAGEPRRRRRGRRGGRGRRREGATGADRDVVRTERPFDEPADDRREEDDADRFPPRAGGVESGRVESGDGEDRPRRRRRGRRGGRGRSRLERDRDGRPEGDAPRGRDGGDDLDDEPLPMSYGMRDERRSETRRDEGPRSAAERESGSSDRAAGDANRPAAAEGGESGTRGRRRRRRGGEGRGRTGERRGGEGRGSEGRGSEERAGEGSRETSRRGGGAEGRSGDSSRRSRRSRRDRRESAEPRSSSYGRGRRSDFAPVAGGYDEDDEGLEFLGVEEAGREPRRRESRPEDDDVIAESGLNTVLDVPSWVEAIGIVIAGNLDARSRSGRGEGGRGR